MPEALNIATAKRQARTAQLAVRFCPVQLRLPRRLPNPEPCKVYAVDAAEINPPEGEQAVSWLLLTTEPVTTAAEAATILRWYTYRAHVEAEKSASHLSASHSTTCPSNNCLISSATGCPQS